LAVATAHSTTRPLSAYKTPPRATPLPLAPLSLTALDCPTPCLAARAAARAAAVPRRDAHRGHRVGDAHEVITPTPATPPSPLARRQHHLLHALTPFPCPCHADLQRGDDDGDDPTTPVT
jgi:hypothetical protein